MLYNKNMFKKTNDKKVLHKIGKHWVAVSIAMLAMIGGGAAATTGVANHVSTPVVGTVAAHAAGADTGVGSTNMTQEVTTPASNANSTTLQVSSGANSNAFGATNASAYANLASNASVDFTNNNNNNTFSSGFGMNNATGSALNIGSVDVSNLKNNNASNMTNFAESDANLVTFTNNTDANTSSAFFSGVNNTTDMFSNDPSLQSVSLGANALQYVSSASGMFENDNSLINLDLTNTGIGNSADSVNATSMFANDHSLGSIQFATNALNNDNDLTGLFANDTALSDVNLNDVINAPTNTTNAFLNNSRLSSVDLGTNFGTQARTNMNGMFNGAGIGNTNDVKNLNLKNVSGMNSMFANNRALSTANIDLTYASNNASMNGVFANDPSLTNVTMSLNNNALSAISGSASNIFSSDVNLNTMTISAKSATSSFNGTGVDGSGILTNAVVANGQANKTGSDIALSTSNILSGTNTYDLATAAPIDFVNQTGSVVAKANVASNIDVPIANESASTANTSLMKAQGLTLGKLMEGQKGWANDPYSLVNGTAAVTAAQYYATGAPASLGTVNSSAAVIVPVAGGQAVTPITWNIDIPVKVDNETKEYNGNPAMFDESQKLTPEFINNLHLHVGQSTKIDLSKLLPSGYQIDTDSSNTNINHPYVYLTFTNSNGQWNVSTDAGDQHPIVWFNSNPSNDYVSIAYQPTDVIARKPVASMTDITNNANSDSALKSALDAFNAKDGQTVANGSNLINAIKNNSALKGYNIDNVINQLESEENGNGQAHVATKDDVNTAAGSDSALKSALDAFNAKNGQTSANGDALINAIKNNDALKNDNLDNVINAIKGAENNNNNLTPKQRLAKLNKLYKMYQALVNSGIFNS